jgi:hypothetical protein
MYTRRGLGQTSTLVQAIITQEGTCPSPSACQRNNPGNLVYAGQPGASGTPGQLATFDTYDDGYTALVNQLGLYAAGTCGACNGQPQTIASTFQIYAPASVPGNNPTVYATNVSNALGVDPSTPLSSVLTGSAAAPGTATFSLPDLSTVLPSLDLSSLGLPDLSSIDPTYLIAGALVIGFAAVWAFRR